MDPIHQFEIKKLFPIAHIGGVEIAFTNSALFMLIGLLLIAVGVRRQLTQPTPLVVDQHPPFDCLPKVVELHTAVVATAPQALQFVAEFGVPDQRREIVDGDRHADVVDRRIRQGLDRTVGTGVVAGGVLVARDQRKRNAYTPDDVRARLHQRFAEAGGFE